MVRRLRLFLREDRPGTRKATSGTLDFDPSTPLVILSCPQCGPDYIVTKVNLGEGRTGGVWTCSCGNRFIPAGGELAERFLRP